MKTTIGIVLSLALFSGAACAQSEPAPDRTATHYGDELEARASRIFPMMSQQAQKEQWMADQENKRLDREARREQIERR